MVQLFDTLTLDGAARICADGSLVAECFAARTGLQDYRGVEVDPENKHGLRDKAIVKVLRPEEEVFAADSMASFAAAPVTVNHPKEMVDASNWKQHGVGEINGDIIRDGQRVRVPVIVRDASAVQKAQTTHKQVSMGYTTKLDFTPGSTSDGVAYDAVQREIRINHFALVPAARGGPVLNIVDERPHQEPNPMKIMIGDAEVDATNGEAVRIAVDGLNKKLSDQSEQIGTLTADLATANTTISTRDGEITALKSQLADAEVTPEKLQTLADARAAVIAKAKRLAPNIVVDGKTEAAIRKEAVTAKLGDAAAEMDDAAIGGAFAALTKDAGTTPQPGPRIQPLGAPVNLGDAAAGARSAFNDMVAEMTGTKAA